MNNIAYTIAEYVVVIEFSLIVIIIVTTYCFKVVQFYRSRQNNKKSVEIEKYLTNHVLLNEPINVKAFSKKWHDLELLLSIIHRFDVDIKNPTWNDIKKQLLHSVIIPLARVSAKSKDWVARCLAAEAFSYYCEEKDEDVILTLINDDLPLVYVNAVDAAIKHGSLVVMKAIITHMAKQTWFTQTVFYQAFDHMNDDARVHVVNCLKNSHDESIKTICYNILLKCKPVTINWDINVDLNADNLWLKLASLKYISVVDRENAIPFLIDGLENHDWQIREASLNCLSKLQATQAVKEVAKCLRDSNWAVGLAAVRAMYHMGDEGRKILDSLNINVDPAIYQVSQHVSQMQ